MLWLIKNGTHHMEGVVRCQQVSFIPAETINCNPPYSEGRMDSCWTKYNPSIWRPDLDSREDCQRLVGIKLQPILCAATGGGPGE